MQIETLSTPWEIGCKTADLTDTSFPSKVPTRTKPSGNSILDFRGGTSPNQLKIILLGTGANNAVLTGVRFLAWNHFDDGTGDNGKALWVPTPLAEFAAVFGNIPGVAGGAIGSSYFFMDTITLVTGNANISNEILSPVGDIIAHIILSAKGSEMIEAIVDLGANATGFNWAAKRL
jgi:hypothetical protein